MTYRLEIPRHVKLRLANAAVDYLKERQTLLELLEDTERVFSTLSEFYSGVFHLPVVNDFSGYGVSNSTRVRYFIVCKDEEEAIMAKLTHF